MHMPHDSPILPLGFNKLDKLLFMHRKDVYKKIYSSVDLNRVVWIYKERCHHSMS